LQSLTLPLGVPLWGLFLFLPFLLAWTGSWEAFSEASSRITSLDARFVQKKTLPILAKPFVSQGQFLFRSPASLRWEYDDPVRSVLLMHGGVVKRYLRDGTAWREESGSSLSVMQTGSEPRVILVPKEASWKKMIRQIELTPSREQAGVMKSVRVVEDERSFTLLEFQQVRLNRPLPGVLFTEVE
jgi:outer membrane lipoprotein-sorting protein